jgi:putative addiction module component (TIGR02574 family)
MSIAYAELFKLPTAEKLQLLEELWDSIGDEPESLGVSQELIDELDRRKAEFERDPTIGLSWEDVQASIRGSNG